MNILITGGCGFVGSNLAVKLKRKYPDYQVTALDNLKRRGSELNLSRLKQIGVRFLHGDIRIPGDLDACGPIDLLIDAAAEPSVLAGLDSSTDYVIQTNLNGTINCLNFARKHKARFLFLSTSRVYPIQQLENIRFEETESRFRISEDQDVPGISVEGVSENFPLNGARSLYGSSKLASELFIQEYTELLGLQAVINRCGVITGPYQMGKVDQGVVVLWVARHFWKGPLKYFGYGGQGKQVRDILHIDDLFDLIDYQMHTFDQVQGITFNVGGGPEVSVSLKELSGICEEVTGNRINIGSVPETRQADIRIYITDNSKVSTLTGWKPKRGPQEIVEDIFHWIKENENQLADILN
jgi:CDP-paratose 2-epimerase